MIAYTLDDVLAPVARALRLTAAPDLALAVARIDAIHRELCALTDWPALRAVAEVSAAGGVLTVPGAAGVSSVMVAGVPYWLVERWDVGAADLQGRPLWSLGCPARDVDNALVFNAWAWDGDTAQHVAVTTPVAICYGTQPARLMTATDRLALPGTRALVVRAVVDLVGLMDRKEADVAPWRAELESSLAELRALNPVAGAQQVLRLASGRVVKRGMAVR